MNILLQINIQKKQQHVDCVEYHKMHSSIFISLFIIATYSKVSSKQPKTFDTSARFLQFTTEHSHNNEDDEVHYEAIVEKTIEVTRKYRMYSEISDKDEQMDDSNVHRKVFKDKRSYNHMQDREIDLNYLGYY